MSLEEVLLEEVIKEEENPVDPASAVPNPEGGEGEGKGEGEGNGEGDEGGRPLPVIPPGGPATPPTNPN